MKKELTPAQENLLNVMRTRGGRAVICDILAKCNLMKVSVASDPHLTYFNEGQRNVGIMVYAMIDEVCPELYVLMCQEAKEDAKHDDDTRPKQPIDHIEHALDHTRPNYDIDG